ncbi:hypothetical protein VCV18_004677 [Metarhizium anisopliae]
MVVHYYGKPLCKLGELAIHLFNDSRVVAAYTVASVGPFIVDVLPVGKVNSNGLDLDEDLSGAWDNWLGHFNKGNKASGLRYNGFHVRFDFLEDVDPEPFGNG